MSTEHVLIGDMDDPSILTLSLYEISGRLTLTLFLPEDDGDDGLCREIDIARFGNDVQACVKLANRILQVASYYDSSIKDPVTSKPDA